MPYLTETEKAEVAELLYHLELRKKINPLEFFEPLPLQAKFDKDPAKIKCIFGGNRSSKTYEGAQYILSKGLKAKLRIWAVAVNFSESVNIQQRKVWELLPKNEIKYGHYDEINGFTNRKLKLKNGTLIIFKSYDQKREAFQGEDMDLIWNDEEPPYDIYKEQRMRLLDRDGEMIITMTSIEGITDLIQDLFEDHETLISEYAPYVEKELPRIAEKNGVKFYLFWTTENPYIDQERTRRDIKLMTQQEILSRIYGIPVNLAGKIYIKFNKNIHIIPIEKAPISECTLYHVLDPHDRKPWAMGWFGIHPTGTAYLFDEYPETDFNEMLFDDKTYDEYVSIINEKEKIIKKLYGLTVRGRTGRILDPNYGNKPIQLAERQGGQSHTTPMEELKKRGLVYTNGIDVLEAGHLEVRDKLYYEIKDGEIVVQPKFFITENCCNSIRHMSRYSRKDIMTPEGDIKDRAKPQEKYKDFCDLIRYFWMANPRYFSGGKIFVPKSRKVY